MRAPVFSSWVAYDLSETKIGNLAWVRSFPSSIFLNYPEKVIESFWYEWIIEVASR